MKTTQEKLKEAEALLREVYQTNEGPRLIAELVSQFPVRPHPTRHPTLLTK